MTDEDDELEPEEDEPEVEPQDEAPLEKPKRIRKRKPGPYGLSNKITVERRKGEFLRNRESGMSIVMACRNVNPPLVKNTYYEWRRNDPSFRVKDDSIRSRLGVRDTVPYKPATFVPFRQKYFGHESPPAHMKIIDTIESLAGAKIYMVLMPPDFGKSTLMVDWISWKLSMDPNHRILYISESQKLAVKMLGRVKRRFTDERASRQMISEWGPYYDPGQERQGKPWQSSFFTVNGADHDEADYSLEATGWSSQIYGVRSDTIILDDYQTLKGANLTDDMLEKFQQDIITRCDKNGRIFIVGTRIASRDFYLRLLEDDIVDDHRIFPAVNSKGESLWPGKWSAEQLDERRQKVGPVIWARAYMMRPQADGEAAFTEEMVNACKDDSVDFTTIRNNEDVWAGYDAAPTKYSALTIAAVSDTTMRILDAEHRWGLTDSEKHFSFIKEMWNRHHFTKLVVEVNAFVKVWARDVGLRKLGVECGFQIIEHQTGANKSDGDFGVARMAGAFIDKSVALNWSEQVRPRIQTLVDELLVWRATIPTRLRTQDMIMATWFVWSRWQRLVAARETPTRQIRIAGTPFTPTGYQTGAFDGRYAGLRR